MKFMEMIRVLKKSVWNQAKRKAWNGSTDYPEYIQCDEDEICTDDYVEFALNIEDIEASDWVVYEPTQEEVKSTVAQMEEESEPTRRVCYEL